MSMKRVVLIILGVVGIVLAVLFLLLSNSKSNDRKYTIRLSVTGYTDSFTVKDTKSSTSLGKFSEDDISLKLALGTYDLTFTADGFGSVTKQITVSSEGGGITRVSFAPSLSASEVLKDVVGQSEDLNISGAKYFAEDSWLVGTTVSATEDAGEVFIVIAKLTSSGSWKTVDVGSFIDIDSLVLDGAPPDLVGYVEGLQ